MKKVLITLLVFALCLLTSAHSQATQQIELKFKEPLEGERYITGEKVDLGLKEVVLKIDGEITSFERSQIDTIKFLPTEKQEASPPKEITSRATAQSSKLTSETSNKTVADPRELDAEVNRAQFKAIQEQWMAQYKGREGYDDAIRMQQELYEALASGEMSIDELKSKAASVSSQAKSYNAYETAEYPELQSLLMQLDSFTAE